MAVDVSNVITAIATTIGAFVSIATAWVAYRSMQDNREASAPDINVKTMRWRTLRAELLLEVELEFRNQSHRNLFIETVDFVSPRKTQVAHDRIRVYDIYHPADFRVGAFLLNQTVASAGETRSFMGRHVHKADVAHPEFYLRLPTDSKNLKCKITYCFGAKHSKKQRYIFQTTIDCNVPDAVEIPLREEEQARLAVARAPHDQAQLKSERSG
jgi:hypothetical protein